MTSADHLFDSGNVQVIDWDMLDKRKFIPFSILSSLTIRGISYPLTVIKTRIQVQERSSNYRGTFQMLRQIYLKEGVSGLYRGYIINAFQVCSGFFYVSTYEKVRQIMLTEYNITNNSQRAFVGGCLASAVSQLILVPFDVISQHMMVLERVKSANRASVGSVYNAGPALDTLNLTKKLQEQPKMKLTPLVIKEIYRRDGLFKGFYRGYIASLMLYGPSSGCLWCFYSYFCEKIHSWTPYNLPQVAVQAIAAPASGVAVVLITNPLDLFRSNLQVRCSSWRETFTRLIRDEGWAVLTKGLSTRLLIVPLTSCLFIVGYECVKRLSVKSDIKDRIQW